MYKGQKVAEVRGSRNQVIASLKISKVKPSAITINDEKIETIDNDLGNFNVQVPNNDLGNFFLKCLNSKSNELQANIHTGLIEKGKNINIGTIDIFEEAIIAREGLVVIMKTIRDETWSTKRQNTITYHENKHIETMFNNKVEYNHELKDNYHYFKYEMDNGSYITVSLSNENSKYLNYIRLTFNTKF